MKKKTRIFLVSVIIGFVFIGTFLFYLNVKMKEPFLQKISGQIYYLKRDDGILKIYRSDANLKNETLIYSHKNKGKINNGGYNDNIIDFCYYPETGTIEFVAMNGEWSKYRMIIEDGEPECIKTRVEDEKIEKKAEVFIHTNYINLKNDKFTIYEEDGSIYLRKKDGLKKCIKKYWGIGKSDISGLVGYVPEGLSPDSKYLIYGTTGSFTGIGALLGINRYKRYIMNLDTLAFEEYVNSQSIQWIN